MQRLGMPRISHAQEDPGRQAVPRIDLSPIPRLETVLPMLKIRLWIRQRGAGGIPVFVQTIWNPVHAAGLKSCFLAKKPILSQMHRAAPLQFAFYHVRWNRQQWQTVMFSDESLFCLRHIEGQLHVWYRNGERHAEVNVQSRHAYNEGSVMVWAGVTSDRRTNLVVVPGILTGQRTTLHRQDLTSSCNAFPTTNEQKWHLTK